MLPQEDIAHIKENLGAWLAELSLSKPPVVYEIELRERMMRLETELTRQRELLQEMLRQMDKRFEQVDKRFEQVDKRFEQVDKRFEQVDKRLEGLSNRLLQFMLWSFGLYMAGFGGVMALILRSSGG